MNVCVNIFLSIKNTSYRSIFSFLFLFHLSFSVFQIFAHSRNIRGESNYFRLNSNFRNNTIVLSTEGYELLYATGYQYSTP
jgi:hypothetical protein